MAKIEILLILITTGNAVWAYINWRTYRTQTKLIRAANFSIDDMKARAEVLLAEAKRVFEAAKIQSEYAVCSECHRIVAHHTNDNGVTLCVNCATNLAQRAN